MAMDYEAPFITSTLELKLDQNTQFEWQKQGSESTTVPHYNELLEFINTRVQASESLTAPSKGSTPFANKKQPSHKPVASYMANPSDTSPNCPICKTEKHSSTPPHDLSSCRTNMTKSKNLRTNCLSSGHFVRDCKSLNCCKTCQRHHTLLHIDSSTTTHSPCSGSSTSPKNSTRRLQHGSLSHPKLTTYDLQSFGGSSTYIVAL